MTWVRARKAFPIGWKPGTKPAQPGDELEVPEGIGRALVTADLVDVIDGPSVAAPASNKPKGR